MDERRIMPDRVPAPSLMVHYRCPRCLGHVTLDAYDGPPRCRNGHAPAFLEPVALDRSDIDPLADINALRRTESTFR